MSTSAEGPIPRLRSESRPCASTCTPPTRVASAVPVHKLPVVLPVVAGGSLPGVAFRHSTVGTFREHAAGDSIFLHPFAPPALPEFLATMGALTPAGRPYRFTPARAVRNATQVSLFHALYRPTLPSPTTPRRPACMVWFDHAGLPEDAPGRSASSPWGTAASVGLRLSLAGSPRRQAESRSSSYGRVVHLPLLSTSPHGDAVTFGYGVQTEPRRGLAPRGYRTLTSALGRISNPPGLPPGRIGNPPYDRGVG